jgi:hypothetical protein
MKRGDHKMQGQWCVNALAVPTPTDQYIRWVCNFAVPTGAVSLAPKPYKSRLRALGIGTGLAANMMALRELGCIYEEEFAQAMARINAGDWEGLFEFIGNDPDRLSDERVWEALRRWLDSLPGDRLDALEQKLRQLKKRGCSIHEDDARQIVAHIGEGVYQGVSMTYRLRHSSDWDSKKRSEFSLKDRLDTWRPVYFQRALTRVRRHLAHINAPATSITHVWNSSPSVSHQIAGFHPRGAPYDRSAWA